MMNACGTISITYFDFFVVAIFLFFFYAGRLFLLFLFFSTPNIFIGKDENNINIEINNFIKGMSVDSAQSKLICQLNFLLILVYRKLWRTL